MFRMRDPAPAVVISQYVFKNCCAWGSVFAVVVVALIFSPAMWVESTVELTDIVSFLWATQFTFIVCLQGFYFAGKAKFLEKTPFNDTDKREHGNGRV